jgi:hypothetical protein
MKTLIKIIVALALIVAAVNGARATFNNYRFEDAVHDALLFNPRASQPEIVAMVMKAAEEYDVPIDAADISVTNAGQEVRVEMPYTASVVLIPGVYSVDWSFSPSTSTRFLPGAGAAR